MLDKIQYPEFLVIVIVSYFACGIITLVSKDAEVMAIPAILSIIYAANYFGW